MTAPHSRSATKKYTNFGHQGKGQCRRSHFGRSGSTTFLKVRVTDQDGREVGVRVGIMVGDGVQ
jgi:hypothetical protein